MSKRERNCVRPGKNERARAREREREREREKEKSARENWLASKSIPSEVHRTKCPESD